MSDFPKPNTIYRKLADARESFHKISLVKTGRNKFAKYSYFELGDFLIPAMQCLHNEGLIGLVSFTDELATMTLYETEGDGTIVLTSPMKEANLKGCHPIQNLGAVETYQRRYLWVTTMDIVEHDSIDSAPLDQGDKPTKKVAKKTAVKKPAPSVEDKKGNEIYIENDEEAIKITGEMIDLAVKMHSNSKENLISFWKNNEDAINYLHENYPDQFERLKGEFSKIKATLIEE